MKKWIGLACTLALALALGAAGAEAKVKACWVYVGAIGDHGYTYQHDQGRLYAQKMLGDKLETVYLENIAEGPDAERAITRLARSGCDIIFTTSFGFMDATIKVAKRFPKVKFEHATGYKTAKNVTTYNLKFHEGRYVAGQIAASVSKTGKAGYIVSFPIPEVVAGIDAFMLGAQSVNPNFKISVIWVNSWYDPGKEADAAKVLVGQGCDILVQHTDSSAPMQVAEEKHIHAFGQASDMIKYGPHAQLTALIDNWGPYYVTRIKALMNGTWKSQASWTGMHEGTVKMAPFTNMPESVAKMAQNTVDEITSGKLNPFQGPIYNQAGKLMVKKGEVMPDKEILSLNWYVKGINDKLPQ